MLYEAWAIWKHGKGQPRKRLFVAIAHVLLRPVFLILRICSQRRIKHHGDPASILLIRVDGIGDLTMSSPVFPALRRRFPGARIDLLTSDAARPIADLFAEAGWLNAVFSIPLAGRGISAYRDVLPSLQANRYDVAIDLRGDMRNVLLMWRIGAPTRLGHPDAGLNYLLTGILNLPMEHHQRDEAASLAEMIGVHDVGIAPIIPLQQAETDAADQWLREQQVRFDRPICAIHPGAFFPLKVWPLERFIAVARRLQETESAQIVLVGGADETELAARFVAESKLSVVVATGKVSLRLLTGILSRCAVFIGNDSGPAHIAAAVGCPAVVLFGRSDPIRYRPLGSTTTALKSQHPCDPRCDKVCARPAESCMLEHTVDSVVSAASIHVLAHQRRREN